MKFCLIILLLCGCSVSQEAPLKLDSPVALEINAVPPPFNMAGHYPYVVWMNGQRVQLPKKDILLLVEKVGAQNIPMANQEDIHRGWLFPYFINAEEARDVGISE